jgi:hypothetical protein
MFSKLVPADYETLVPYFDNQVHRLCYYSLSSFICWSHHISYPIWRTGHDTLLIIMKYRDNPSKDFLYLPISHGRTFPPSVLKEIAVKCGIRSFRHVPHDYVEMHDREELESLFNLRECEDFSDYIYKRDDLAFLKGNKYSKKRNLIHQFLKSHVDQGRVEVHPFSEADIAECLAFLDLWSDNKVTDPRLTRYGAMERKAADMAVRNICSLGYKGHVLRIDGKIQAFGIGSELTEKMGGFHFEKAAPDIKGLYQYFDQQCALHLFKDHDYINKECDMGIAGLRHSKRSYHPAMMVRCFELAIKEYSQPGPCSSL